VASKVLL